MTFVRMLVILVIVVSALGCTVEYEFGDSSVDLAEVFNAEIAECQLNIQQQDQGVTSEIVLTGTLTAIKEVDVESLTAEGFVTIGDGEPESLGTAMLEDRSFRTGDTWDFRLTSSKSIEGFAPIGCNVGIDAKLR